ncbi:hypothetical protein B0H11DRAFT_62665 [Mycena galericulata]|nr:hypothetical protein B0H11DRAFT_62665 [Mycena galericulata]
MHTDTDADVGNGVDRRPRKRMRTRRSSAPSPPSHSSHFSPRPSYSPPSPASPAPAPPAPAHPPPSPLLALPPELLTLIALRLATLPPNLGPPAALLPLLLTCRGVYERLTWRVSSGGNGSGSGSSGGNGSGSRGKGGSGNPGLWARIARAKFALPGSPAFAALLDSDYDFPLSDLGKPSTPLPLRALHTHLTTLRVLRTGDPYHPLAARALRGAYAMLVADADVQEGGWGLGTAEDDDADGGEGGKGKGKGTVKERVGLSSGTPSLAALGLGSPSHSPSPSSSSSSSTSRVEGKSLGKTGKNRHQLAWAGARAFALRWVRERLWEGRFGFGFGADSSVDVDPSFGEGRARARARGEEGDAAGPWTAGWPRDTPTGAAALWVLWFFEDGATLRPEPDPARRHLMSLLLPFVVAPFRYPSSLCPPHHYTVPLLPAVLASRRRGQGGGGGGGITVPTHHGAYPIYALGAGAGAGDSAEAAGDGARQGRAEEGIAGGRGEGGRGGRGRGRLLTAPPARLLLFARMQVGGRMGVPSHLARDRAAAAAGAATAGGGPGTASGPPIGPTQADIHEKNARPVVRFERQLEAAGEEGEGVAFVDGESEDEDEDEDDTRARWAAHAWRARLCRRYGDGDGEGEREREERRAGDLWVSVAQAPPTQDVGGRQGRGGAAPGRIGRVYQLGSFAGLWSGTMLMPSEAPYNALLAVPGGAFPAGGLARDDFVAAARPVYMRIAEYHSFHPHTPLPPPPADSTTGEEGMREGWLPPGTRVVGIGGGRVEVRADAGAAAASSSSLEFASSARRREETAYVYETVVEGRVREGAHDVETCPGCARVREREREMRAVWAAEARGAYGASPSTSLEDNTGEEGNSSSGSSSSSASDYSSSSQGRASSSPRSQAHDSENSLENDSTGADADADWPEWSAPTWGKHRFDEGWEGACDGVQDVVFSGGTDPSHGMAWHHYEYAGRVRPWDGLIGLVMRPRNRTIGLATYFISGHLVGRDTFEGTWQMASQDVLAPSWGGSVCFARAEE